jgi:hypothetical protein
MKIISIDVGIKNLAYCVLEIDSAAENNVQALTILNWDSINLCENKELFKCIKCLKKASYYCYLEKIEDYADDLENDADDLANAKKTYWCSMHSKKIENTHAIVEEAKVSANKMDLVSIGLAIKKAFDARFASVDEISHIVIENQISPIATRMKTIQGMLMQYFIMRGIVSLTFASAINKLKAFTDKKKKISYKDRKKLGIDVTARLVNDLPLLKDVWTDYFKNHQKKDDLADSFLQGVWYLQSTKMLGDINLDFEK